MSEGIKICRGYKAIGAELRVTPEKVRDWVTSGAPIYMDGETPYADAHELWDWRKKQLEMAKAS